jgi:hypothetical protein
MKPRYAGAWHNLSPDGFRALIAGLNRAHQEGYAPIHFSTTSEGFAVILEESTTPRSRESATPDSRSYPHFFEEED